MELGYRHHEVQRLRRLATRRRSRRDEHAFVVEGTKLLAEALTVGAKVDTVFAAPDAPPALLARAGAGGARVLELAPGVLERVATTVSPQPVMAIVGDLTVDLATVAHATLVVVCVDLGDPGNAGTVLRSAEAAGAGAVVLCGSSVDVYNPKTVRASAGAVFHVPVVAAEEEPVDVLLHLGNGGLRRLGTVAGSGRDYTTLDLTLPVAIVLGNEAVGLPPALSSVLDDCVTIPMTGRSESLNVGMAAAVLCFEAARQRRAKGDVARGTDVAGRTGVKE
jgi:RNA methyltransferase, TrmH family